MWFVSLLQLRAVVWRFGIKTILVPHTCGADALGSTLWNRQMICNLELCKVMFFFS